MRFLALVLLLQAAPDDWAEFAKLASDQDFENRCKAVDLVRKYKDRRMAQALLPLLADEHPRVVHRVVRALGTVTDPEAVKLLHEAGLLHKDARVRRGTAEALGRLHDDTSLEPLSESLRDPSADVAAEAAQALGKLKRKEAAEALRNAGKHKAPSVRAFALEALGACDPASAEEPVRKAAEDREYAVRMVAAETAPKVSPEFGVEIFKILLDDKDWRVRVSAIEAAAEIRRKDVIGPLIDRLAEEHGRMRWDLLIVLKDLTDKDLGLNPKAWKEWWTANEATFEIVTRGQDGSAGADVGRTQSEFFRVPILSTRVIFLLDLSGSMRDKAPADAQGRPTDKTMLDIAKQGMVSAIESLEKDVFFGITGLGGNKDHTFPRKEQKTWRTKIRLHPASPANKADAVKWVRGLEAWGFSNDFDALAHAFEDPEVDTIYLYGDGGTSRGTFTMTNEQLDNLVRMNRFRKIMIHSIEIPGEKGNTDDNVRFLTGLAERTKGTFTPATPEKK